MKKLRTFTLAEVLITLAIIGVVAALTIPTLWAKIGTIVNSNRKEVIEDRLLEGLNQLNTLDNGLTASQYEDTEGFVKALSKYYKMSQICGANDLQNCFPYSSITYTTDDGEATINVTDLKTAENFKLSSDDYLAPAGFISAQGTPFIMLLNKDCVRDTGEAMRSIPTSCIQYMYDRNGANNPNKLGTDIIHSTNLGLATTSSEGSTVTPDGTLAVPIGSYTTYLILNHQYQGGQSYSEQGLNTCTGSEDASWDGRGDYDNSCSNNKWAAAKKACSDAGYELPDADSLAKIGCRVKGVSRYQYQYNPVKNKYEFRDCDTSDKDNNLAEAFAQKVSSIYLWSSTPQGTTTYYAYALLWNSSVETTLTAHRNGTSNNYAVVCLK